MQSAWLRPLLALGLVVSLAAAELRDSFESRAEIRGWIEERKGFGRPEFDLVELEQVRYYFARFVPTSGLAHCHVYTFRESDDAWHLLRHARLPGGCRITIRVDPSSGDVVYLDPLGVELDRLSSP